MTATATLEFSSPNPVSIDWGDGTRETHAAAPDGVILTHEYAGEGSWRVSIQDRITWRIATQLVQCGGGPQPPQPDPNCITGGVIHITGCNPAAQHWTIGPLVNPSGGQIVVDWGWTTETVNSGQSSAVESAMIRFAPSFGPYTVNIRAADDPLCAGTVSGGGNYPSFALFGSADDTQLIWANFLTAVCVTPDPGQLGDKIRLYWYGAGGPATDATTHTIDWGDGTIETGVHVPAEPVGVTGGIVHEYGPPGGQQHTVKATNEQTGRQVSGTYNCPIPPPAEPPFPTNAVSVCNVGQLVRAELSYDAPTWSGTPGLANMRWRIDWGDGQISPTVQFFGPSPQVVSHTYADGFGGLAVVNVGHTDSSRSRNYGVSC